jgi:hypothetical protein
MNFDNEFLQCKVDFINMHKIKLSGIVPNMLYFKSVLLIAPNSATKTASYSGTGLPFPCADIAFEGTPNIYQVEPSGTIDTIFSYPNSYYTVANKKKIVSSLFAIIETHDGKQHFLRLPLKDMYPLRTLVNRETRTGPEFYALKHEILPVDSADIIMQEYAKIKVKYGIA